MNKNACNVIIKIWNIAQIAPGGHCNHHGKMAIKIKISSPANILPNNRKASESGFTHSSTILNAMLTGNNQGPNGNVSISLINRCFFALILKKTIRANTLIDIAKVAFGSAVGT